MSALVVPTQLGTSGRGDLRARAVVLPAATFFRRSVWPRPRTRFPARTPSRTGRAAARAPERQLGVAVHAEPQDHEVGADICASGPRRRPAGRDRDRRRRAAAPRACAARSRSSSESAANRASDGFGSPRRWWRTSAARNATSDGREAAQLRVLDEVGGVPVVALAATRAGRCRAASTRTRASRGRAGPSPCSDCVCVEQPQCEAGHVRGVVLVRVAAAGEVRDRGAPQRARVVRPVVGIVRAHRVEHDAFAQRPVADRSASSTSNRSSAVTSSIEPGGQQLGALLLEPGHPAALGDLRCA